MTTETTIVIPTWNSLDYLPRCIEALALHSPNVPVIVVDNASHDGTVAWLDEHAPHVAVLRNDSNTGFGAACNQGVEAATTPWVCLLNADAFVTAGWLDSLHAGIASVPDATIAGPMLLNTDGSLQEAGCMISRHGDGVLYGSGDDPDDWRFLFPRVVDYCSGACLLISRDRFRDLGGFDVDTYGLAYYEDVDLCLRAAADGDRTVYVPDAQVIHVRNASSSSSAIRKLLERNRKRFTARWEELLARRPIIEDLERNPHRMIFTRDADRFERLLVLARDLPATADPTAQQIIGVQTSWPNCRVTVVTDSPPEAADARDWLELGIEIANGHGDWYGWFRDRPAFFTTVIALSDDAFARFGALVEWTQVEARLLRFLGRSSASPWRPFHGSVPYLLSAPCRATWTEVDRERPIETVLTSASWPRPERTSPS